MKKVICLIGAFDTKGPEYAFVRERILERGHDVLTVNTGVLGTTDLFPVDVEAGAVAAACGGNIESLRAERDRGAAMKLMCAGAAAIGQSLHKEGRFDAIMGMGGTGGTAVITAAMRPLPVGVPKICVSTAAAGDVAAYVDTSDIVMVPSVVDVSGINRISRIIYARAAGAICGMAEAGTPASDGDRPVVAATMFGNTTDCVDVCREQLTAAGYEVLVFHATGTGGRTMEALVDQGLVDAVLDITTTEWADQVCGGQFAAGPDRLSAPGRAGIPHLIVPGCVDMVNFGPMHTVPARYRDDERVFYEWNPSITLMRTNTEENREMGRVFAEKAGAARGPVAFLLPLGGVSILDGTGEAFCDREADAALFAAIRENIEGGVPVVEMDNNINDPAFAEKAVEMLLEMIDKGK